MRTTASTRPPRQATAGRPAGATRGAVALILIVLAVPRIVRMLWPQVWIEDESYLNGAFLLATSHAPYTAFPLPHFPLLEGALAALFEIFPIAIRTAEAFTAVAAWVGSILVWRIGRRLGGEECGVAAAIIFATSPLLFRYHVFEREVFLIVPVLAASWLALREPAAGDRGRQAAVIEGLLVALAMAIKLTAASYAAALFLFILLVNRQRERAVIFLGTVVVLMGVSTAVLWALFGTPFLVQVVLFRLVHAGFHSLTGQFHEWLGSLDVELAAGAAGLALVCWGRRVGRWALPLLHLGFGILLLVALNPTFWAHDSIELLPWLALFGGVLVADVAAAFSRPGSAEAPSRPVVASALAGALVLFVMVVPLPHANWGPGAASGFGFGYRDRAEVDRVAAYVRSKTAPGALVATPPILAFQANRPELVTYPELAGTIMTLEREVEAKGAVAALETSEVGQRMFWDEVAASRDVWLPDLARAIQDRRLGAVIDFSPADLFPVPLIDVPDQALRAAGYVPGLVTEHYTVWTVPN